MYQTHNIGALLKGVTGVAPAANAAGAVNGAAINRQGYGACALVLMTGLDTGSPSARSATAKLQESADGSTGWTDVAGASVALTAVSSVAKLDVNLAGVKQFIRVVNTTAFTAGTSPTLFSASSVILGGADKLPAV